MKNNPKAVHYLCNDHIRFFNVSVSDDLVLWSKGLTMSTPGGEELYKDALVTVHNLR